jgi:hypothetical protein
MDVTHFMACLCIGLVVEDLEQAQQLGNPEEVPHTPFCADQRELATGIAKADESGGQISEAGAVNVVAGREVHEHSRFSGVELLPDLLP